MLSLQLNVESYVCAFVCAWVHTCMHACLVYVYVCMYVCMCPWNHGVRRPMCEAWDSERAIKRDRRFLQEQPAAFGIVIPCCPPTTHTQNKKKKKKKKEEKEKLLRSSQRCSNSTTTGRGSTETRTTLKWGRATGCVTRDLGKMFRKGLP